MLKHTFRNIICILEPLDKGQKPSIQNVLEGRHFFVHEFWRVGTMGMPSISVETYFQEYDMYFRAIRMRPDTPDPKCSRGQALFRSWISGGGHYGEG